MKAERAWQATLGQLQMEMSKAAYETWLSEAELVSYEDGSFIVGVPNGYARDWLESRLTSTVKRLLSGIMNRSVEIRFIVWRETEATVVFNDADEEEPIEISSNNLPNATLNNRYSFDNFIVGTSNRLAHAASLAVAERPAQAYNPLFLYGGVGLGKTHLLHAIGNMSLARSLNVLYVSAEEFCNDLINAIRSHNTQSFRDKYRCIDVLLIDDIQFIAGKESTQEEFFHTFNTLHSQDKQIVISSDRPPKALFTLEERLRSRFEWGLIVDIQPPDYETRLAILHCKADRRALKVPHDVMENIARRVQSNIRELEGALNRIAAFAHFSGLPLTSNLVDPLLADLMPRRKNVAPEEVLQSVSDAFGITMESMLSRDRSQKVALPRQVAMYLLRREANISLPQIGMTLGGRDHTTVMYACEKIADLLESDDRLRRQVVEIREQLFAAPGVTA